MATILHLLSNWKWTERAEPAADLALGQQLAGAQARFACGRPPHGEPDAVAARARQKGLDAVELDLPKHFSPISAMRAWPGLLRAFRGQSFDILHAHMANAHLLGGAAARRVQPRARIVCSFYESEGPPPGFRQRLTMRRLTDGAVVTTPAARDTLVRVFGFPEARIMLLEPGLDLDRYASPLSRDAARAALGLAASDTVIGLVTRIRAARRLDLALAALARLATGRPGLKLLIVGRGGPGAVREVIEQPAEALGIRDRVVLAGYRRDGELAAAYKAMDLLVYPCPGTDPSCRTVREALAAGVPVAGCAVGGVPNWIREGEDGLLADSTPDSLAAAIARLADDPLFRASLSRGAAASARRRFDRVRQAERCLAFYESLGGPR